MQQNKRASCKKNDNTHSIDIKKEALCIEEKIEEKHRY